MLIKCGFHDFVERTGKCAGVVCFGAGKRLKYFEQLFAETSVVEKVVLVLDNAVEKWGTKVDVGEKEIDVISIEKFKTLKLKGVVILITCARYGGIVEQLNEEKELDDVEYYIMSDLSQYSLEDEVLQKEIPNNIRISQTPLIPKVIHYCWFGKNPIPDRYKEWMESWHKYCPEYKIIIWNEDNYDITKSKYMLQSYEQKKWGFVPDYARLDIIYEHGGIYLDTDVELVQSLDELLYQKGFVGFERNEFVNFGSGFGAVKGFKLIKELRECYNEMSFINADGSLNMIASPKYQTEILKSKGLRLNGEYQIVDEMTVYPEKMFNGMNERSRKTKLKPYTRSIHHYDASWLKADTE